MGFSVPRTARLPETNHIMWIVFVINVESSPLFGRVPEDLLPLHYHISCIHGLRKENWGNTNAFYGSHPRPSRFVLLSILCPLGSISYSLSHYCLSWLAIAIWSSQFNVLHVLPANKGPGSNLLCWVIPLWITFWGHTTWSLWTKPPFHTDASIVLPHLQKAERGFSPYFDI